MILLLAPLALAVSQPTVQPGGVRHVTVSFSAQGALGSSLTGLSFTGYSATVCSADGQGIDVGGGRVWQAAESLGLRLVTPHVASLAATQAKARSKWQIMAVLGAELMFDMAVVAGADIVHVNPAKVVGKVWRITPIILNKKLGDWNAQQALVHPDLVSSFGDLALYPDHIISVSSGGNCPQRLFLASSGGPDGGSVDLQIAVLPPAVVFAPTPQAAPVLGK
jgi:hypothetical protein